MVNIKVAIINASTVLKAAIPALQTQAHRDFAPAGGIDADLTFTRVHFIGPCFAPHFVLMDSSGRMTCWYS